MPHLPAEKLPVLADYDQADNLVSMALPHLDPQRGKGRPRHIFFGLMWIYKWQYTMLAILLVLKALLAFLNPIAVNQLLKYLETGSQGLVWSSGLGSVIFELYIFATTRLLVRTEAIITQLVFEHALRMRFADNSRSSLSTNSAATTATLVPPSPENKDATDLPQRNREGCVEVSEAGMAVEPGPETSDATSADTERKSKDPSATGTKCKVSSPPATPSTKSDANHEHGKNLMVSARKRALANCNVNYLLPMLVSVVVFGCYTLIMKEELTASRISSSITAFELITEQLWTISRNIPVILSGKVSLDRIDALLNESELLDRYTRPQNEGPVASSPTEADIIGLRKASFGWKADIALPGSGDAGTPSRNSRLRIDGDLFFESGRLNLIIGPTGSGKTYLLMALVGEMHCKYEAIDSFVNLPRGGGIALSAHILQENITFGAAFDHVRYRKGSVLHQCALGMFDAGDATEVGKKGLTLSGGQKARLALARTLYPTATVVLLDDIFSALDAHTSGWIVGKCLRGDLLRGRTVLLVTHNVAMTAPLADFVVSLGPNGSVTSQNTASETLHNNPVPLAEVEIAAKTLEREEGAIDEEEKAIEKRDKLKGQLIAKEEIAE
ncbi:hypothetical protein FRB98_006684 [Tulasnella sp. 332]|nr:hypothetical protein FRB98_006684 [Tulasnella sp. 332]